MRWSWQILKVAGIPIRVHATFVLVIVWAAIVARGEGTAGVLESIAFVLALFTCIVLHELGHALMARRYGVRTRDITLLPIGGVARLERIPEKPRQEIAVALAGPAVNIVIAAVLFLVLFLRGDAWAFATPQTLQRNFLAQLLATNIIIVVFNLIPAFPMDGGRVLRALLAIRLDYLRATQIAANVGQGIAFLFGLLGLFVNPFLLLIAFFVFVGAGQEAATVQMRSAFDGIPVWRAMIRDFRALAASEPLSRAVELLLDGHQQDFPVIQDGPGSQPLGILTRSDLLRALAGGHTDRKVGEVARHSCGVAHPRELLESVIPRMQESGCPAIPVVEEDGSLVGMVTLENVGELAMVQAALGGSRRQEAARTWP
jgi:Zn-dependent protease/CBS domain-containing protein